MTDTAPAVPFASRKTKAPDWLLTPEEVAVILGISRRHLLREVDACRMQCSIVTLTATGKPRRRYTLQNLQDYVDLYCRGDKASIMALAQKKLAA